MTKKIGILTSGGDAPGMNAAIRSIVLSSYLNNIEIYGIYDGYLGLFQNNIQKINKSCVYNIINKGGTILGSMRFDKFHEKYVQSICVENISKNNLDALIIIGGNGSYMGAKLLAKQGIPCITLPGTIDNDIYGTEYSIGFSTALETIVEAIDRLHDTSTSLKRISIVEVMGRSCGDLAILSAISCGCEFVIFPELPFKYEDLIFKIRENILKGKKQSIIVITENICNILHLSNYIKKETKIEATTTVLGHIQRGGIPVSYDRILATRMGVYSIKLLLQGKYNKCIGIKNNCLINYSIFDIKKNEKHSFCCDFLKEIPLIY